MRVDKLGIPRFILIKADEYISAEHVLLALLSDHQSLISKELKKFSIDKEKVLLALSEVRGSHRIADENAEEKLNTLEKYGQDITDSAENRYLNN